MDNKESTFSVMRVVFNSFHKAESAIDNLSVYKRTTTQEHTCVLSTVSVCQGLSSFYGIGPW